jgi:hypothetical protein
MSWRVARRLGLRTYVHFRISCYRIGKEALQRQSRTKSACLAEFEGSLDGSRDEVRLSAQGSEPHWDDY